MHERWKDVNWDDDYSLGWIETDDPRLLAVIQRDDSGDSKPWGDALAPAYWIGYRYGWQVEGQAGETFSDDDIAEVYVNARSQFGDEHVTDRFMRIFHDTTMETLFGPSGDRLVIFNSPAYRQHVGIDNPDGTRALNGAGTPIDDSIAYSLDGEKHEFQAWLDGEVYGIGWAVNPNRVTNETPVNIDDFEVDIQCWGFFGEEYAIESALNFEHGAPELDLMLDFT